MPITVPEPPEQALAALRTALPRILSRPGPAAAAPAATAVARSLGRTDDPGRPEVSAPVYVLGLRDLAGEAGLAGAELVAWTHVLSPDVDDDDAPASAADVDARTWQLAAVTEGPPVTGLRRQVRELRRPRPSEGGDGAEAAGEGSYDLRVLRVPALYLTAVWLRGQEGTDDVFVPLPGPAAPLEAGRRYGGAAFLEQLRPLAGRILEQTSDTSGG